MCELQARPCKTSRPLALHCFNAKYFNQMLEDCKRNLPVGQAIMVMDYAMNWTGKLPREVQSMFFSPWQVSLMVCIVYRHQSVAMGDPADSTPENPLPLVKDFVFGISDDLKHHARVSCGTCPALRASLPCLALRAAHTRPALHAAHSALPFVTCVIPVSCDALQCAMCAAHARTL